MDNSKNLRNNQSDHTKQCPISKMRNFSKDVWSFLNTDIKDFGIWKQDSPSSQDCPMHKIIAKIETGKWPTEENSDIQAIFRQIENEWEFSYEQIIQVKVNVQHLYKKHKIPLSLWMTNGLVQALLSPEIVRIEFENMQQLNDKRMQKSLDKRFEFFKTLIKSDSYSQLQKLIQGTIRRHKNVENTTGLFISNEMNVLIISLLIQWSFDKIPELSENEKQSIYLHWKIVAKQLGVGIPQYENLENFIQDFTQKNQNQNEFSDKEKSQTQSRQEFLFHSAVWYGTQKVSKKTFMPNCIAQPLVQNTLLKNIKSKNLPLELNDPKHSFDEHISLLPISEESKQLCMNVKSTKKKYINNAHKLYEKVLDLTLPKTIKQEIFVWYLYLYMMDFYLDHYHNEKNEDTMKTLENLKEVFHWKNAQSESNIETLLSELTKILKSFENESLNNTMKKLYTLSVEEKTEENPDKNLDIQLEMASELLRWGHHIIQDTFNIKDESEILGLIWKMLQIMDNLWDIEEDITNWNNSAFYYSMQGHNPQQIREKLHQKSNEIKQEIGQKINQETFEKLNHFYKQINTWLSIGRFLKKIIYFVSFRQSSKFNPVIEAKYIEKK